ncbi:MAG: bi-domain-containing oxidoreductase [Deltaproteobacteria bacterium]|nr:bi-domain-containing oxidoreductase [Deltaproteobacteria bacterium]
MKQVVQSFRTGELSVADVPAPGVEPGCVLVLVRASLVSAGTEKSAMELAQKSLLAKARARPDLVKKVLDKVSRDGLIAAGKAAFARLDAPQPLGYACAGLVAAVGAGVSEVSVGDRVACAGAGIANHAEVVLVPQNLCAKVPDGVADEEAAFATLGAIALHAVRQAQPTVGETFAVVGLGLLGQLVCQLLQASGCSVLGVDLDPKKVALAQSLGAQAILRSEDVAGRARALTQGRGVDGVIIAASTSSSDPIELAGEICRDRARVVGLGATGLTVPRRPYFDKELVLLQSRSYGPGRYDPIYEERGVDYPLGYVRWTEGRNLTAFLEQVAQKRVKAQPLISHRFAIEEATKAYALLSGGPQAGEAEPLGIVLTYGAQTLPPREVNVTAPKTHEGAVRVGIVGAGAFAGSTLAPILADLDHVRLSAIGSARGLTARHLAEKHGIERATTDAEALLTDPELDALVIATRHHLHADQTARALAAGKHVFVEKPLALNDEQLKHVLAAQKQSGKQLFVGFNRRFSPLVGELTSALAGRAAPLLVQIRVNAGEIPGSSWLHDPEQGGGRILGEVCHFIDLAAAVCGAQIESVFAVAPGPDGGARGDDQLALTLRLTDGSAAQITYATGGDSALGKERIEVHGGGVSAVLEDFRKLEVHRHGKTKTSRPLAQDKGHRAGLAAFIAGVRSGKPAFALGDLVSTTRATFAAVESLRSGFPIRVDHA